MVRLPRALENGWGYLLSGKCPLWKNPDSEIKVSW